MLQLGVDGLQTDLLEPAHALQLAAAVGVTGAVAVAVAAEVGGGQLRGQHVAVCGAEGGHDLLVAVAAALLLDDGERDGVEGAVEPDGGLVGVAQRRELRVRLHHAVVALGPHAGDVGQERLGEGHVQVVHHVLGHDVLSEGHAVVRLSHQGHLGLDPSLLSVAVPANINKQATR